MVDIGNSLGRHLKMDLERAEAGMTTYARTCVEVDISKGLPEKMILNWNNHKWVHLFDYENTSFWCKIYQQIGHLHESCPLACASTSWTKGLKSKEKRWNTPKPPPISD